MNLDDVDMAEGATGNEVEFQFAYDALNITPVIAVQAEITKLRELSGEAFASNDGYINPVFQVGASAADAGGTTGAVPPVTEEQSLVDKLSTFATGVAATAQNAVAGVLSDTDAALLDVQRNVTVGAISGAQAAATPIATPIATPLIDPVKQTTGKIYTPSTGWRDTLPNGFK